MFSTKSYMFSTKSYLQYKNTPDGKPRVLVEDEDYNTIFNDCLYMIHSSYELTDANWITKPVANICDCRPFSPVMYDEKIYTEMDITKDGGFIYFDIESMDGLINIKYDDGVVGVAQNSSDVILVGSFFDNPTEYSKLLWNCDEKEGWKKVFKLLDI